MTFAQSVDRLATVVEKLHGATIGPEGFVSELVHTFTQGAPRSVFAKSVIMGHAGVNSPHNMAAVLQNPAFNQTLQAQAVKETLKRVMTTGGSPIDVLGKVVDEMTKRMAEGLRGTRHDTVGGLTGTGENVPYGVQTGQQRRNYELALAQERMRNASRDAYQGAEIADANKRFGFYDTAKGVERKAFRPPREVVEGWQQRVDRIEKATSMLSGKSLIGAKNTIEDLRGEIERIARTGTAMGPDMYKIEGAFQALGKEFSGLATQTYKDQSLLRSAMPGGFAPGQRARAVMARMKGWFGLSPTDELKSPWQRFSGRMEGSMPGAAMIGGGLLGSLAASSPVAWSTLTTSFEILGATIGRSLIPGAIKLSGALQRSANWVERHPGLSSAATMAVGALISGPILYGALQRAVPFLRGSAVDVKSVAGWSLGTHGGLLSSISSSAAGIAFLGFAAYKAGHILEGWDNKSKMIRNLGWDREQAALQGGLANSSYVKSLQERMAGMTPDQRKSFLSMEMDMLGKRQTAKAQEAFDLRHPFGTGMGNALAPLYRIGGGFLSMIDDEAGISGRMGKALKLEKESADLQEKLGAITNLARGGKAATGGGLFAGKTKEQLEKIDQVLFSFGSMRAPVATGGVGDLWSQIQVRALEQNPAQQRLLQIQLQGFEAIIDEASDIKAMRSLMEQDSGLR